MKILLYQPDIAGNVGTIARLCSCMNIELNIIEPCGFLFDDKKFKRAAMDYLDIAVIKKFSSFRDFKENNRNSRIVLLTTHATLSFNNFKFRKDDILMAGRESAGVPEEIHQSVDERILIPMKNNARSINLALSVSMVLSIAMKECDLF